MSSNILKPKKTSLVKMLAVAAVTSSFFGCTLDPYIITAEEEYTRNFIKDFGLIDEKQDWNLAKTATISINLGPEMRDEVKVYGKHQSKFYLVAELNGLSGTVDVPVDLPKDCHDLLVVTGGRKYHGNLGSTIDCSDMSRGIPNSTYDADGTNPNPAKYEKTESGYTVTVKHTKRGNGGEGTLYAQYNDGGAYQYFNTQQMSPLISTTVWDTYYSANTQKWTENLKGSIGLLPESGVFNRPQNELTDWITAKRAEGESIVRDFHINTGDDGSFTIFPYYYGTNLKHELGVYLLDEENNPILKSGTYDKSNPGQYKLENFVSFPVFQDRAPGDLQVQAHYDPYITGIRLKNGNPTFELGELYHLQDEVEIERGKDNWMSYAKYIEEFGSKYHSRVAYHFWVDEEKDPTKQRPDSFARIYNNGIVHPLKLTKDHNENGIAYANVAIATGLDVSTEGAGIGRIKGVESNFNYKVVAGSRVRKIEIAEKELKMCAGDVVTLTVTLKDKDGKALSLKDYFDEISVTGEWDTDKCRIYKDESDHTIKIKAVGTGECWPRVYVTESEWDGIHDYVHVLTSPHHVTKEYTGNPDTDAVTLADWKEKYFESSDEYKVDVTDKLYEKGGQDQNWAFQGYSNKSEEWGTRYLDKDIFTGIDNSNKLRIKLDGNHKLLIKDGGWNALTFDYKVGDTQYSSDTNGGTIEADEFEVLLNDEMLTTIQNVGMGIVNISNGDVTYNKVELARPLKDGEVARDWKETGQEDAKDDLVAYYKGKVGSTTCDYCGQTYDFSNITPEVTITDDAGYEKIHYTVTWAQDAGTYSVSKYGPNARKSPRSRSVSSREYDATASHLNPGPASDWKDVNSYWSRLLPHQEEVASFPPNVCMLARSRGYDVIITYGTDEEGNPKPWKGNLGMYLKVLGSYDILSKTDANGNIIYPEEFYDHYTDYENDNDEKTEPYVVFSQNRFNKAADGSSSNQISALSVKHPASGRTFLTFEDMRLTDSGVITPDQFWKKSSDRDVNDLIFNITNFGSIANDDPEEVITEDPEEPVDDTNSWLWAVEDLGATDDFDFNDMVMKITSVTRNSVKKDDKGNQVGDPTLMFKKVTFMPLCAGGTLPLFVHYAPEATGTHYTLRPGAYVEPELEYSINDSQLITLPSSMSALAADGDDKAEIHRWFGVNNSTEIINTRSEGSLRTVKEGCTLYLNTSFTISGFGADGSTKGRHGGLYVTVNDGRSVQFTDDITSGWTKEEDGEGWVIVSPKEGSASQMFMIVDADTPWRWPRERTHILNPYPDFTKWVGDMNVTERWYDLDSNREGYTFPRYDIKK